MAKELPYGTVSREQLRKDADEDHLSEDTSRLTLEEFVEKYFKKVTKSGNGYSALCPAHNDKNPSLSIGLANRSNTALFTVKCHKGCTFEAILDALGLPRGALNKPSSHKKSADTYYVYTDEHGKKLYRVCRTAAKDFFQERFEDGEYKTGLGNTRRVLYKLPELVKANTVFIVEGEKDVETLRALGLVATTNSGGAGKGKWNDSYAPFLKDKVIYIIPDNDDGGREHAMTVARSVLPLAKEVRIIELPGVPEKGDVTDYLAVHTKKELLELVGTVEPLTLAAHVGAKEAEPVDEPKIVFPEEAIKGCELFKCWDDITSPVTEAPREYRWATMCQILGLSFGRGMFVSNPKPLYGNSYTLLVGATGDDRKSTTLWLAQETLKQLGADVDIVKGIQSSEAIYTSLSRNGDQEARSLLYFAEISTLMAIAQRSGTHDLIGRLQALYDCEDDALSRRKDKTVLERPFLSMIAGSTLEELQYLMVNRLVENGFINRFTMVTGEVEKFMAHPGRLQNLKVITKELAALKKFYGDNYEFEWTSKADAMYTAFYNEWKEARKNRAQTADGSRDNKLTARIQDYVLKVAMWYAAANRYKKLNESAISMGIQLGRWQEQTILNIFSHVHPDIFAREERRVIAVVAKQRGGKIRRRDLAQHVSHYINGELLSRIIASLVKNSRMIEYEEITSSGQTAKWVQWLG